MTEDWKAKAEQAWHEPGWRDAARDYHANRPTIERNQRARSTPVSTIEAILFCVRERGLAALDESTNRERLERCDAPALAQIDRRIANSRRILSNEF